jgi:hypothetical protein
MAAPIIASFCAAACDCAIAAAVGLPPAVCTSSARPREVVTVLVLLSGFTQGNAAARPPDPNLAVRRGSRCGNATGRAEACRIRSEPRHFEWRCVCAVRIAVRDAERHQPSTIARLRARTERRNPVFAPMDRRAP